MEKAEGPFLLGSTLDLKATQELLEKCEEAAKAVHEKAAAAEKYTQAKVTEVRPFGEAQAKRVREGFVEMKDRLTKIKTKVATFEKDLKERTKASKMVEAAEKVDELEKVVKETLEAAAPFLKEDADKMSEADAAAPLKKYMEVEKEAHKTAMQVRTFLTARQREQKGVADQEEAIKKLQERVAKTQEELAPAKKACAPHEQRSLGTRLLAEAKEQVGGLEAEVKKATDASAPLLEHGG